MKSIKPGRGQSGISFIGSIFAIVFGIFWTIMAFGLTVSTGVLGPMGLFFPMFGILFILLGIVQAFYHFKNTTSRNRFSVYDITEPGEEDDPSLQWINHSSEQKKYCPYCGEVLKTEFAFCPSCGKALE